MKICVIKEYFAEYINGRIRKGYSCIRGFHVYQDSWTPFLDDRASDLYVKMSQVIQEIDMLSRFEIS